MGPQNTMHTYKRSVNEFHVDVLEIDLQLSSDGHVVLIHDPYVLRIVVFLPIFCEMSCLEVFESETDEAWLLACVSCVFGV